MKIGYGNENKKPGVIYVKENGEFVACSDPDLKPSLEYLNAVKKIKPSDIQKGIKRMFGGIEKKVK